MEGEQEVSRYIDADALKTNINTAFWSEIEKVIDSAPSIDIVRCKECRYWIDNCDEDDDLFRECRWRDEETPDADDYCSYGERREP